MPMNTKHSYITTSSPDIELDQNTRLAMAPQFLAIIEDNEHS